MAKGKKIDKIPSTRGQVVLPESSIQMVNNYGTYEIQPTANTENQYPAIAQGFNKKIIENDCENIEAEKSK
ncbi:MAG: hypothetical protein IJD55_03970 [Clostridia bacterium]|nr:hypothetical protein [Clostridia bacterium]